MSASLVGSEMCIRDSPYQDVAEHIEALPIDHQDPEGGHEGEEDPVHPVPADRVEAVAQVQQRVRGGR
eukprot:2391834-Alexandrium_andersonii.AAC.1